MVDTAGAGIDRNAVDKEGRSPRPPVLDPTLLLTAFVKSIPVGLIIGLLVGVIVGVLASTVRPVYTATTTVSVGTPSRAEKDASTMEALAAGMSEFVTDARVHYFIEERTGEKVTVGGISPTVEVTTSKIPGVLEVVTRSRSGPLNAMEMGRAVVDAMNLRASELRDEFLAPVVDSSQAEIDNLNEQIQARRNLDRTADTSDLLRLIYEARASAEVLRSAYPAASIISQDDSKGDQTWPKPVQTGVLVGLVVTILASTILAWLRIRRPKSTDSVWVRLMGHRHGAVVETDVATAGGLPVRSEAAVSGVLSADGTVVILGDIKLQDVLGGENLDSSRLHIFASGEKWWRQVPGADVDLGVVVVKSGGPSPNVAENDLVSFSEIGVPTRLVILLGVTGEQVAPQPEAPEEAAGSLDRGSA